MMTMRLSSLPTLPLRCSMIAAIVLAGWAAPSLAAGPEGQAKAPPRGIFGVLSDRQGNLDELTGVLKDPRSKGVTINVLWKSVEPAKDRLDWTMVEHALRLAEQHEKCLNIRVIGGAFGTPDWLYEKAAAYYFVDTNPHHRTRGEILKNVKPWDPYFVERWKAFITAFANKVDADPRVCIVYMTGPARTSGEMQLPPEKDLRERPDPNSARTTWAKIGGNADAIYKSWDALMRHYAARFTRSHLGLATALLMGDRALYTRIVDTAIDTIGNRLCLQGNWVSGRGDLGQKARTPDGAPTDNVAFQLRAFQRVKSKGGLMGAQALGVTANRMGDFQRFVDNVAAVGYDYVELQAAYFNDRNKAKYTTQLYDYFNKRGK